MLGGDGAAAGASSLGMHSPLFPVGSQSRPDANATLFSFLEHVHADEFVFQLPMLTLRSNTASRSTVHCHPNAWARGSIGAWDPKWLAASRATSIARESGKMMMLLLKQQSSGREYHQASGTYSSFNSLHAATPQGNETITRPTGSLPNTRIDSGSAGKAGAHADWLPQSKACLCRL